MNIFFAYHRFGHMGKYSGYARLTDYLKGSKEIDLTLYRVKSWSWLEQNVFNRKLFSAYNSDRYGPFHYFERCLSEYEIVEQSNRLGVDLVHLAYLEDYLGYIVDNRDKLKAKIVATSHQPPEWWKMTNKNPNIIKCLDAVIVLSLEAKEYFEQFLPGKVFFIPHGIDIHFFTPASVSEIAKRNNTCVFAGNWMRDFTALAATVTLAAKKNFEIEFNIVSPKKMDFMHPLFSLQHLKNVIWHRSIDDESLLSIYRNMAMMLLPLTASTCNNSLLEAAACGMPVIVNKCGGVTDYLDKKWSYLTEESSPEQFLEKINYVMNSSNNEKVKLNAGLQKDYVVDNFSWETVAAQTIKLYQSL